MTGSISTIDKGAASAAMSLLVLGLAASPIGNIALLLVLAGWPSFHVLLLFFRRIGARRVRNRLAYSLAFGITVGTFALMYSYARLPHEEDLTVLLGSVTAYQLIFVAAFVVLGARFSRSTALRTIAVVLLFAAVGAVLQIAQDIVHATAVSALYGAVSYLTADGAEYLLRRSTPPVEEDHPAATGP